MACHQLCLCLQSGLGLCGYFTSKPPLEVRGWFYRLFGGARSVLEELHSDFACGLGSVGFSLEFVELISGGEELLEYRAQGIQRRFMVLEAGILNGV